MRDACDQRNAAAFHPEIYQPLSLGETVVQKFARSAEKADTRDAAIGEEIEQVEKTGKIRIL